MVTIKEIQTVLKKEGFYKGAIDGIAGPYTIKAIRLYQAAHGLVVDGIAGKITQTHMGLITVPTTPTYQMGYYINRVNTPLENIDFSTLKSKGITEVYIRCAESNYKAITEHLPRIKAAGLKPYAWTWKGYTLMKETVALGWNICHDLEVYDMANHYDTIKTIQGICKASNKTFILCTKAQDWDGDQKWSIIKDYCDYISPMLYLGDYNKTIEQLSSYMKAYNTKYPGKIYPALETYVSDSNAIPKSSTVLKAEIAAVKPYSKGLSLFRYGISNL